MTALLARLIAVITGRDHVHTYKGDWVDPDNQRCWCRAVPDTPEGDR